MKDTMRKVRVIAYTLASIVPTVMIGLPILFGIFGGGGSGGG